MARRAPPLLSLLLLALPRAASAQPHPETLIQYFETSWAEITQRMPELAAAGYTALWLPPATKGAEGAVDVGFSVYDRFDLGDRDQRGTIATKYGTKEEVIALVREAHRFGIKVYFDTVMNHNANPGKIENAGTSLTSVPIDQFPGTAPLDYHVLPARDAGGGNWEVQNAQIFGGGTYVLTPNMSEAESFVPVTLLPGGVSIPGFTHLARAPWIDFSRAGQVEEQNLSLLGLIDFALEQHVSGGAPGPGDGRNDVAEQPLPRYIRLPERPETYPNSTPVPEDIREYMMRWVRWFGDTTDCDGLRLDAIKHVPTTFFNRDFPNDPVAFNAAFQDDLDQRRGYGDGDDDDGDEDALLFGESFTGDFASLESYRQTGMYLLDFPLLFRLAHDGGVFARSGDGDIGQLSFPQGGMAGAFNEFGGLGRSAGVAFVQSHDTDAPAAQPNAAYAFITTRVGHAVVFYDGNNSNPANFVRPGRLDALGELGSTTILDLLDIRRRYARGGMFNRFVDGDTYVYERVVPTIDGTGGATLLVALTDSTQSEARFGEFDPRPLLITEFPPGTVLSELTGNGAVAELTVLDPAVIPQAARDRAVAEYDRSSDFPLPARYGFVYLQIPAGPNIGYVAYGPKAPPANLALTAGGAALASRVVTTAPQRHTPAGAPIPAAELRAMVVPMGATLEVEVSADASASKAYLRIDGAAALPGQTPIAGSSEGLYDGFVELPAGGAPNSFRLAGLDVSGLPGAVHLAEVRVALAGTPSFYSVARAFFVVADVPGPDGGVVEGDGGLGGDAGADAGPADSGIYDPDPDHDGIPSDRDLCPEVSDPEQSDFDGDGVGNACDACAETEPSTSVDALGCPPVDQATQDALDLILQLILEERYNLRFDRNNDGVVDALDYVLTANGGAP